MAETWFGPCPPYRAPTLEPEPEPEPEPAEAAAEPALEGASAREIFERYVKRTPEQCAVERALPQRSPEWIRARKYTLTASKFADAAGWMGEGAQRRLALQMAGRAPRDFANAAMRYGTAHEPLAREAYLHWLRLRKEPYVELREAGLVRHPGEQSWIAASPDGILVRDRLPDRLVEFKCPYYRRNAACYPYKEFVPRHYMAQIQGVMALMGLTECDFVVYQPHRVWITRVAFDRALWETQLLPALREFYFRIFLPLLRSHISLKRPLELELAAEPEPATAAPPVEPEPEPERASEG